MNEKKIYYSRRLGKLKDLPEISFTLTKKLFFSLYLQLSDEGYFQKYFGKDCVDGDSVGELGRDILLVVFLELRKDYLWPIYEKVDGYNEDDLFDVIEFLYEHCSKPIEGNYHSYNNCGMHYHSFDDTKGKETFRNKVNKILNDYSNGFELSDEGQILMLAEKNLEHLFEATIPSEDKENVNQRVDNAVLRFRRHKATLEDRRLALRDLADVLEYLRPQIKITLLSNDEKDIFNIANNFGIRHHNLQQKHNYNKAVWYSWIFYYYLATIHASIRLIAKQAEKD
jgi:hypothetical protein